MKNLSLFLIVFGLCLIGKVYSDLSNPIIIKNDLERKHKYLLFVHCKSGNKDQGRQFITAGKDYRFNIKDNFWGTTLFWCTFGYGPQWKYIKKFDIYKYDSKVPRGGVYTWIARNDGIYFQKNQLPERLVHTWDLKKPGD
ncbi:unnamed protein product [Thlaspi arvense]|uniref:S-protein homolog n=1 Tax=Thlaspi arvense TaxID=13288 RepID=A0AAU9RM39_THLAR|nr:unnamed protein product [Thlaspi arvense]